MGLFNDVYLFQWEYFKLSQLDSFDGMLMKLHKQVSWQKDMSELYISA